MAAIFPGTPTIRDIVYTNGERQVPARQFYVERGADRYSVTIADFTNVGAAIDDQIIENATIPIRQRGEVRFQFPKTTFQAFRASSTSWTPWAGSILPRSTWRTIAFTSPDLCGAGRFRRASVRAIHGHDQRPGAD